jgi:deoxyribodipyrimidine photolyase-related protein
MHAIVLPCDVDVSWIPEDVTKLHFVEAPAFFSRYPSHKAKLALMRTAMKAAAASVHGKTVEYVDHAGYAAFLARNKVTKFLCKTPCDVPLEKSLAKALSGLTFVPCGRFLLDAEFLDAFHAEHGAKRRILFSTFFKAAKAQLRVLQGVASTDAENRRGPDRTAVEPVIPEHRDAAGHRAEAIAYVDREFGGNPGRTAAAALYPATPAAAKTQMRRFVAERLPGFARFQDAIVKEWTVGHHANVSAALNMGILSPNDLIKSVLAAKHASHNDVEAFVRQVIGWREYMRYIYVYHYREITTANRFGATRTIGPHTAKTAWYGHGTDLLANEARKALDTGYAHHIVRLMVFLNKMVLDGITLKSAVRWFSTVVAIDAYDWVMYSNVAAMGHFTPKFMRKPYVSKTAYLQRMSDYKRDEMPGDWNDAYDAWVKKTGFKQF